ncbi:MAG: DUF6056 family protein [Eubacteriales bacterium]|nr:DUF6056 family protein [Eubacteriales bacterium]
MSKRFSLSHRLVAWLCILALLAGIAPMVALSFYNHAFYDDFGFSILTHEAWQTDGTLGAVLQAAVVNTFGNRDGSYLGTYRTWEGTYATSFVSALQPAVFGEGWYWLTTCLLLGTFLLALWYFLQQALRGVLGLSRAVVFTALGALGFVAVQFAPSPAEGFFWFNGGVAYTFLWSVMLFTAGLWLRFDRITGKLRTTLVFSALLLLSVIVGGAKYSTVLLALLLAFGFTVWAFARKRPKRWAYAALAAVLLTGFAASALAPGNAVRGATLSGGMGAPKAVLEAVYFGLALMGNFVSLPLIAALLVLVAMALPALRQSRLRFRHPIWVTLVMAALFCAQLAPTLYTGNYLGDGRVRNTYYFTYLVVTALLALYWAGHIVRCGEGDPAVPGHSRLHGMTALVAVVLLAVGCAAYHPEGSASYGPQNMAGGSALRAIVSGQAAAYNRSMDERDAILNDPAVTDVTLTPVANAPALFMGDALDSDNLEYVLNLYADYYGKTSVTGSEGEE